MAASGQSDEQQITNALSDYCWYVDRRDVDAVLGLFTPDGTFDLGHGRVHRGQDSLRRLYERLDVYTATSHHLTNPHITVAGETAAVRSGLYAYHRRADSSELHLWGTYTDVFHQIDGRWLVATRSLRASAEHGGRPEGDAATHFEPLPRA